MVLGNTLIWLSLIMTALAMALYMPGIKQGRRTPYLRQARWAVDGAAIGLWAALGYLWYLLLTNQFQYEYIYQYSGLDMQLRYVVSALWGGQQGTLLLWAGFAGVLAVFLRFKAKAYEPAVQFFYMGITFFLLLMLTKASPFKLLDFIPEDGRGLNPLLQDPWMTIHPPITFFGFAALGIPAAYAMAALVKEDWDEWIPRALPWTVFGVLALGIGLTLGGYWAYSILGWGGFWGWDPVENSSLVPWLVGIALIHTQIIQLRQGKFRKLNLILSLLPFLFLTYSTFLTRSGVLADFSVHSFTDLGINQYLVAFMAIFLGGGLLLFLNKMNRIPVTKRQTAFTSREYFLFLGSAAFALFGFLVCLGTSTPLLTRLFGTPSTIQPEFYNRMGLPFIIIVSILMGIGPHLLWYQPGGKALWRSLRLPLLATAILAPLAFFWGIREWPFLLMLLAGAFALFANIPVIASYVSTKWMAMGGPLSHAGVGLMTVGILTSTAYDQMQLVELPKGQDVAVLGYTLRYIGSRPVEEGRKNAYDISVSKGGSTTIVSPLMYYNDMSGGMMKKPAIKNFLTHDVYIAPGGIRVESIADRTMTQVMELEKAQTVTVQGIELQFQTFEMPTMQTSGDDPHSTQDPHQGQFVAVMHAVVDGEIHTLRPTMVSGHNGIMPGRAEPIPGTDYAVQLVGIDAGSGRIGISVGHPPVVLGQHESGSLKGYEIHFGGFEVEMVGNNQAAVMAQVQVTDWEGQVHHLAPGFIDRKDMERELIEVPIGTTGLNIALTGIDTQAEKGELQIVRPPAEAVWVEASLKPFIVLLWIGTALVMVGMVVSTGYRGMAKWKSKHNNLSVSESRRGAA